MSDISRVNQNTKAPRKGADAIPAYSKHVNPVIDWVNDYGVGGVGLFYSEHTENLATGTNTIAHNKYTTDNWKVIGVQVWDGDDNVNVTFKRVDNNTVNIYLGGGSITGAEIYILYKKIS